MDCKHKINSNDKRAIEKKSILALKITYLDRASRRMQSIADSIEFAILRFFSFKTFVSAMLNDLFVYVLFLGIFICHKPSTLNIFFFSIGMDWTEIVVATADLH